MDPLIAALKMEKDGNNRKTLIQKNVSNNNF